MLIRPTNTLRLAYVIFMQQRLVFYLTKFLCRDRLVGSRGRDKFDGILSSVLTQAWSSNTLNQTNDGYYVTWGARQEVTGEFFNPKIFSN